MWMPRRAHSALFWLARFALRPPATIQLLRALAILCVLYLERWTFLIHVKLCQPPPPPPPSGATSPSRLDPVLSRISAARADVHLAPVSPGVELLLLADPQLIDEHTYARTLPPRLYPLVRWASDSYNWKAWKALNPNLRTPWQVASHVAAARGYTSRALGRVRQGWDGVHAKAGGLKGNGAASDGGSIEDVGTGSLGGLDGEDLTAARRGSARRDQASSASASTATARGNKGVIWVGDLFDGSRRKMDAAHWQALMARFRSLFPASPPALFLWGNHDSGLPLVGAAHETQHRNEEFEVDPDARNRFLAEFGTPVDGSLTVHDWLDANEPSGIADPPDVAAVVGGALGRNTRRSANARIPLYLSPCASRSDNASNTSGADAAMGGVAAAGSVEDFPSLEKCDGGVPTHEIIVLDSMDLVGLESALERKRPVVERPGELPDELARLAEAKFGETWRFVESLGRQRRDQGENAPVRILIQHVPLFRPPTTACHIPDSLQAVPHGVRREGRYDGLRQGADLQGSYQNEVGKEVSDWVLAKVRPAVVFSGDDHDHCEVLHEVPGVEPSEDRTTSTVLNLAPLPDHLVPELTLKAFSMTEGVRRPGFGRLHLYATGATAAQGQGPTTSYAGNTLSYTPCLLPDQLGIWMRTYPSLAALVVLLVWLARRRNHSLPQRPRWLRGRGVVGGTRIGSDRSGVAKPGAAGGWTFGKASRSQAYRPLSRGGGDDGGGRGGGQAVVGSHSTAASASSSRLKTRSRGSTRWSGSVASTLLSVAGFGREGNRVAEAEASKGEAWQMVDVEMAPATPSSKPTTTTRQSVASASSPSSRVSAARRMRSMGGEALRVSTTRPIGVGATSSDDSGGEDGARRRTAVDEDSWDSQLSEADDDEVLRARRQDPRRGRLGNGNAPGSGGGLSGLGSGRIRYGGAGDGASSGGGTGGGADWLLSGGGVGGGRSPFYFDAASIADDSDDDEERLYHRYFVSPSSAAAHGGTTAWLGKLLRVGPAGRRGLTGEDSAAATAAAAAAWVRLSSLRNDAVWILSPAVLVWFSLQWV